MKTMLSKLKDKLKVKDKVKDKVIQKETEKKPDHENTAFALSDLLTPREVAAMMKITVGTLESWRGMNRGPQWIKLGSGKKSPIRYRKLDVDDFLLSEINNKKYKTTKKI